MRVLVLFVFIFILSEEANQHIFPRRVSSMNKCSLEKSLILGEKRCIKPKLKRALKELSLLHLFTPSGLHLSSVLIFSFFHKIFKIFIVFASIFYSFGLSHLLALQRVSVFYGINLILKNTKLSFLTTFSLCLVFNQYNSNPMSFLFSFIFWFIILTHNKGKIDLIKKLFLTQALIALILNQSFNVLSLVINPALTFLLTLCFPVLLILFITNLFTDFRNTLYEYLSNFILEIHISYFSLHMSFVIFLFLLLTLYPQRKYILILLVLFSNPLGKDIILFSKANELIYPLARKEELIKVKGKNIIFVDRKCRVRNFRIKCKVYPDHMVRVE